MKDVFGHPVKTKDKVAYVTSKGIMKKGIVTQIQSDKRLQVFIPDEHRELWTYNNHILKTES